MEILIKIGQEMGRMIAFHQLQQLLFFILFCQIFDIICEKHYRFPNYEHSYG